ncbi:MAG: SapC family protein [Marivita sp.]|jgi:hypothetical protein
MIKIMKSDPQMTQKFSRALPAAALFLALSTSPFCVQAQTNNQIQEGSALLTKTAFFYADPQVLNTEQHRDLRIALPQNAGFAAGSQAVPVLLSEFADVALEYPIVFVKTPDASWLALALTGLQQGQNVFVDENGAWGANYIPASVRRYPFVFASGDDGTLTVAVDMDLASKDEAAVRLFNEDGAPSVILQNAIGFLQSFQGQSAQTSALIAQFEELGLLTDAQFQIRDQDGNARSLNGFFMVEEARLNTLRDDTILDLVRKGQMGALHLHLLSLKNIAALQRREAAHNNSQ